MAGAPGNGSLAALLDGRSRGAQEIYQVLRTAILGGILEQGQRLVEETLARDLSVSRTPVREALHRLETEGLVEGLPRRGVAVTRWSRKQLADMYAVREALEGLVARLASQSIESHELADLERINAEMAHVDTSEANRLAQLNQEFHDVLVRATHNPLLQSIMRQIYDPFRRFRQTTMAYAGRPEAVLDEHRRIVAAITMRDADAAEREARQHMVKSLQTRFALEDV